MYTPHKPNIHLNKRPSSAFWGKREIPEELKRVPEQISKDIIQRYELTGEERTTYAEFIKVISAFDEGISKYKVDTMGRILSDALKDAKVIIRDSIRN